MSLFLKDARQELRIEMFPDAWKRFHGAVHLMTRAGPQHRPAIEKPGSKVERGEGGRPKGPSSRQ